MKKRQLDPELQHEAERLAALPDATIDLVDIPEIAPEAWDEARRRPDLYRPIKRPVTLRLDADVIAWFKEHAASGRYQTEINRVLRRHVANIEQSGAT